MRYSVLGVLLLTGCVTYGTVDIDYSCKPPDDWPTLRVSVDYVAPDDIVSYCGAAAEGPIGLAWGCSKIDFKARTCRIVLRTREAKYLEHERAHCAGYDHVGNCGRAIRAWDNIRERYYQLHGR